MSSRGRYSRVEERHSVDFSASPNDSDASSPSRSASDDDIPGNHNDRHNPVAPAERWSASEPQSPQRPRPWQDDYAASEGVQESLQNPDAYNEGTSSNLLSNNDLENQTPPAPQRLSAKQRVLNAVNHLIPFKQTYELLHNGLDPARRSALPTGRLVGQGTDGVFRNLTAKPETEATRAGEEQFPPTYEEAATDASPEYWEATMISPMYEDEVFVKGLPVGNLANFVWNVLVTVAFQLVGFILCYLLHTSHAAKQGTRAGLGITLIMYGWSLVPANFGRPDLIPTRYQPDNPNSFDISKHSAINSGGRVDSYQSGYIQNSDEIGKQSDAPFMAYGLIALGSFIILKSLVDFFKIKQEEKQMLAPPAEETTYSTTQVVDQLPYE